MFFLILGAVLWVILALWPAFLARKKGYSFVLFFIVAIFISWLLALIITLALSNKNRTARDIEDEKQAQRKIEEETS